MSSSPVYHFHSGAELISADLFKVDPNYLQNEERYVGIKKEILGDSEDEESGESGSDADTEDEDDEEGGAAPEKAGITDMTETNLINLRRTIYLTIMNSVSPPCYSLCYARKLR